ncbi:methyltransferase [Methanoplanus sp. FWC-SCC4]|uniref:Methyltransferase n=1 Tax=Methanochimaera problematica TaxID=2609417 RepID=A0AA97I2L8_9EURY|nr:HemK2/MTQ2 family protein methyltransferase [Methanoplanus sp. FWC-SCC4]WOF15748.1 methyltransferase [Methanoplanus sp. FWC-SCC4]
MQEFSDQVYQPEEDTYLLLKTALREVKLTDRILEVGTGSGLIASEMTKISKNTIAVDINPHACKSAKKRGVEIIRSNLMTSFKENKTAFDLILFNPPYLPTKPEEKIDDWLEYALDGGINGRETIEEFAKQLNGIMSKTGRCLLLISSLTGPDEVAMIFSRLGFLSFIVAEKKVEDEKLYVIRIINDLCRL